MNKAFKDLENLEFELKLVQDNIRRVKRRVKSSDLVYSTKEVGELKHRLVAVKSTMTRICNYSTENYRQ